MKYEELKLKDALLIKPTLHYDERGVFIESYNKKDFSMLVGKEIGFVQDNYSFSKKNVLRGLHFQAEPQSQAKLIQVIHGEVYDVIVDIRKSSKTYRNWLGINLSSENKNQIWIPEGFAHGFLTLSESAEIQYKVTKYYNPNLEYTLRYDDPGLGIKWPNIDQVIISEKDREGCYINENISFE